MNFFFIRTKRSVLDIPWTLMEMGYDVFVLEEYEFDPLEDQPAAYEAVEAKLEKEKFSFVISYCYFPKISDICERLSVDYISWTYDSPLISLFHPSIYNFHNYLFIFDRAEYEYFRRQNVRHIYYLPMGVNLSRTGALQITREDEVKYAGDISFIGHLYEDNFYNEIIHLFPEHLALELKTYLMKNLCNWKQVKEWPRLSAKVTEYMDQTLSAGHLNCWDITNDLYYGMLLLTRKLAEMDRITVLNALAERFSVELYTNSRSEHLTGVHIHESVDYDTEMNKIFYLSKINLNITLPSIETGLPQRVFDIMGCGGFVLTNYQPEVEELFTVGKEIEVFHDLEELLEKTEFYLSHEKERLTIAINGYKKVREEHTYAHRIKRILKTIEEETH